MDIRTWIFQSTLSMRRATGELVVSSISSQQFQSTLSMRRATATPLHCFLDEFAFQSTLSMRRATLQAVGDSPVDFISIHALHEESDPFHIIRAGQCCNFNPRSP